MHEAALMNNLMQKILAISSVESAEEVTKVHVWLGALSHMTPEHFTEHFHDAAAGTIAQYAKLEIETSSDINDPDAQAILLRSVDVKDAS